MAAKPRKPAPSPTRKWVLTGAGLLAVAIGLAVWNAGRDTPSATGTPADDPATASRLAGTAAATEASAAQVAGTARTLRSRLKRSVEPGSDDEANFPHVDRILDDESITDAQAAAGFLEIVQRPELDEAERYEALAHGLTLDFPTFAALAKDPELPVVLAERLLEDLANRNESRLQQLEGFLALMDHRDEEIRSEATAQLAFLVENEELESSPAELRQFAATRIETLRQAPPEPPTGEPAEETAEETAEPTAPPPAED